jgi:hypothetical protein
MQSSSAEMLSQTWPKLLSRCKANDPHIIALGILARSKSAEKSWVRMVKSKLLAHQVFTCQLKSHSYDVYFIVNLYCLIVYSS